MKKIAVWMTMMLAAAVVAMADDSGAKKEEVELKGKLGCGHCSYHQTDKCSAGLKTAEGKIYTIENADKKVMDARLSGAEATVTGTVTEKDGKLYVAASKVEIKE